MLNKFSYVVTLLLVGLFATSCQSTTNTQQNAVMPTLLVAQIHQGEISANMDGNQLLSFARKLELEQATAPAKKRLSESKLVEANLELSGPYVYLISSFEHQPTGNNIKVATELQQRPDSPFVYEVSL